MIEEEWDDDAVGELLLLLLLTCSTWVQDNGSGPRTPSKSEPAPRSRLTLTCSDRSVRYLSFCPRLLLSAFVTVSAVVILIATLILIVSVRLQLGCQGPGQEILPRGPAALSVVVALLCISASVRRRVVLTCRICYAAVVPTRRICYAVVVLTRRVCYAVGARRLALDPVLGVPRSLFQGALSLPPSVSCPLLPRARLDLASRALTSRHHLCVLLGATERSRAGAVGAGPWTHSRRSRRLRRCGRRVGRDVR